MPRPKTPNLTEAELRLMEVLWNQGPATVADIADRLPRELDLAYNSVLTTMRILEEKGYVSHTKPKDGRAYLYRALVGREEASRKAVRVLLSRFFQNSPELLVLNLLGDRDLSAQERDRITKLLDEKRES